MAGSARLLGFAGTFGVSRRRVVGGGALGGASLVLGGALAACGAPAQPPAQEKVPATIKVKTWTNIINMPWWEKAVTSFNERHAADKLSVTLEHVPSEYWTKLTAEYAAGTPPDVIYGSPLDTQDVATKGMLRDLTPEVKADKFNIADINPPAQVGFMFDGKIWGLACWNDTRILSINKSAFQAAGIPLPPQTLDGPGWTVEDFVNAARKLNDPANNKYAFIPEGGAGAVGRLAWLFGAYYWNDEKVPTRSAFDSPEYVRGLEWGRDLQTAHRVMAPLSFPGQFGGHDKMFPAGMMPIAYAAYKHITAGWQNIKDFEWSVAPLPRGTRRMHHVSPQAFAAIVTTKHPKEAWTVVKDYSTGEANTIMASVSSMPSYRKTDIFKVANVPQERRWMIKLINDAMNAGKPLVPHPNVKLDMTRAMDAAMTDLLNEKVSAQEAAKQGADKVNAFFDQYGIRK
ncbi:MAG: extracellular solute-binding protein [Chloroflexota bacterium]|nr:extracellular solute-binding protein [Chloroflexota bacterium]